MDLTVLERIILLGMTQKMEGSFALLKQIRAFQEQIGFSEDENAALNFEQDQQGTRWKDGAVGPKAVIIEATVQKALAKQFRQMNDQKVLRFEHMSLYEKFCPPVEEQDD